MCVREREGKNHNYIQREGKSKTTRSKDGEKSSHKTKRAKSASKVVKAIIFLNQKKKINPEQWKRRISEFYRRFSSKLKLGKRLKKLPLQSE